MVAMRLTLFFLVYIWRFFPVSDRNAPDKLRMFQGPTFFYTKIVVPVVEVASASYAMFLVHSKSWQSGTGTVFLSPFPSMGTGPARSFFIS